MISMPPHSFTLLVVDDEKQNRLLLTELFQDDYRLILAKNGEQALARAREHLPDLILLDVLMPEMDGLAVIRELKRQDTTRHIPVIFITALDSPTDEEQGFLLGASDYIGKPFHAAVVRARVRNQLQIVHQRRLLEQLASLDGLTGIPNRRQFDQAYKREWHRCQRSGSPLSLLVADVDHFKKYNDSLGHAAGDRVLQEIAAVLRDCVQRPGDLAARYGGEEFVVLLPETGREDASMVAGRILDTLRQRNLAHPASPTASHVSMSIGGICFTPTTLEPDDKPFTLADAALYQAKAGGRNRIVWAPDPL